MARALHLRLARDYLCLRLLHHDIRPGVLGQREECAQRSLRGIRRDLRVRYRQVDHLVQADIRVRHRDVPPQV